MFYIARIYRSGNFLSPAPKPSKFDKEGVLVQSFKKRCGNLEKQGVVMLYQQLRQQTHVSNLTEMPYFTKKGKNIDKFTSAAS